MRIQVKVIPRAKGPGIQEQPDGSWRVAVSEPAEGGRANNAVIGAIAKQFDVPKSSVRIVRGHSSRSKQLEID